MEITKTHLKAIQEVAAALRMTVNEFLTEEVRGIAPEQAREYLKARSGFTSLDQSTAKLRWTVSLVMPPI